MTGRAVGNATHGPTSTPHSAGAVGPSPGRDWVPGAALPQGSADPRRARATIQAHIQPVPSDNTLRAALRSATKAAKRKLWLRGRLVVAVDVGRRGAGLELLARLDVHVVANDPKARATRVAEAFLIRLRRKLSPECTLDADLAAQAMPGQPPPRRSGKTNG